ncbi:MAG: hypothetical protein JWQ21_3891, partial [Herminiimonas sp.]|nr:hypothetical protein [Herminiimonas sp.]
MEHTLVAVFDSEAHAQNALNDLMSSGFSRDDVHINASQQSGTTENTSSSAAGASSDHESIGEKIKSFFHHMFDREEDAGRADIYSEAVKRGSHVLTVTAKDDDQVMRATDVLNRHNPIDVDERASQWKSTGWMPDASVPADASSNPAVNAQKTDVDSGTATRLPTGKSAAQTRSDNESKTIPVTEEQLQVGKREVQRGGVRVFQRVTEKPVQESVQLREEHVKVERHPVDQPATAADMAAFKEG